MFAKLTTILIKSTKLCKIRVKIANLSKIVATTQKSPKIGLKFETSMMLPTVDSNYNLW